MDFSLKKYNTIRAHFINKFTYLLTNFIINKSSLSDININIRVLVLIHNTLNTLYYMRFNSMYIYLGSFFLIKDSKNIFGEFLNIVDLPKWAFY